MTRYRECRARTRGVSIVETLIAAIVAGGALMALGSAMWSAYLLRASSRESALAYNAARDKIEEIKAATFSQVFSTYKTGGTTGDTFTVSGLTPITGVSTGQILFPTSGSPVELRENITDTNWSMPRDLSGDGTVDTTDHSTNYKLLPVRIQIRWKGTGGEVKLEVNTLLTEP